MNIMQMMQQAQNLQKKLKVAQDELGKMEITGEAADGAVIVTCDGQGKFKSIKIKPELINPDEPETVEPEIVEVLEDVVTSAMLKATMNASKVMEEKIGCVYP